MQRTTFVCWDCRKVSKGNSTCSDCHQPMESMGRRWKPPRRTQDHKWKQQYKRWATGYLPNGRPRGTSWWSRKQEDYVICRWCGQRVDYEHERVKKSCASQDVRYPLKFHSSIKGVKKR